MDIERLLDRMTLPQKIGQVLTFEFLGIRKREDTLRKIEELHCGGLRITPHVHESIPYQERFIKGAPHKQRLAYHCHPDAYAELIEELQTLARQRPLGLPLHIAIDQEGDFSCDYARGGVQLAPSAMGMAATGDPDLVYRAYKAVGRQLRAVGATMVHSPVLDVNINPNNPEICTRAFGDGPDAVASYAAACMRGFLDAGMVPTAKHFPGRGNSETDLHYTLDVDRRPVEAFEACDLPPYRALIAQGLPAVMTSHQICPAFGDEEPASVSPALHRYLRETLGFEGVITTDAMGMRGVIERFDSYGAACVAALCAGADLVLAKTHPEVEPEVFEAVRRAVEDGQLSEAALNDKVRRILAMKARQGLFDASFEAGQASRAIREPDVVEPIRQAAARALMCLRDDRNLLPLDPEQDVLVIEPYFREWQSKGFDNFYHPGMLSLFMERHSRRVTYLETGMDVTEAEREQALALAQGKAAVVVSSLFWRSASSDQALVKALVAQGHNVIVVANVPYERICLPEVKTLIVNWGQVPHCQRAAADFLYGKAEAPGQWPLTAYARA